MTIYNNLMQQIDDAGLLFNVAEDKVTTASGLIVPNKKALINTANNEVMGVVSEAYRTVANEEIFSVFCAAIEDSGINAHDAQVNIKRTANGSRAIVDFTFPNESIQVRGDDSATVLQICALNSFDGSLRYMTKAGGLRMKCLNGQVLGDIVASYSSTHCKKLAVEAGADKIIRMVEEFNNARDYWGKMMQTPVTDAQVGTILLQFLDIPRDSEFLQNKRYNQVFDLWRAYRNELGRNAYAFYNTLTDYVSHQQPRSSATEVRAAVKGRNLIGKCLSQNAEAFGVAA